MDLSGHDFQNEVKLPEVKVWLWCFSIWWFPLMGVPKKGWFTMENQIKMDDDWECPYDSGNLHMLSMVKDWLVICCFIWHRKLKHWFKDPLNTFRRVTEWLGIYNGKQQKRPIPRIRFGSSCRQKSGRDSLIATSWHDIEWPSGCICEKILRLEKIFVSPFGGAYLWAIPSPDGETISKSSHHMVEVCLGNCPDFV